MDDDSVADLRLYQLTQTFIEEKVLSLIGWADLSSHVAYWINGRTRRKNFTDLLPMHACTAAGGVSDDAIPISSCWLLSMLAARIFDDIQDQEGDHLPWNIGGTQQSLPTALAFISAANISLSFLEVDAQSLRQILGAFGTAAALASKSQANPPKDLTLEQYFQNIVLSSGAVFAATTWAGARVATANEAVLQQLKAFGYNIGIRDAIRSDCYDLLPKEGNPSDLSTGVYTLPVIYAVSLNEHPYHKALVSLLEQDEPLTGEQEEDVRTILNDMGAVMWSLWLAYQYHEKAIDALAGLPEERAKGLKGYVSRETEHIPL